MTQTQHHVAKLYKNPEQFPLNRNSAFMTFEPSKVRLGPPQEQEQIENYINANLVEVGGEKVIATQGPLTAAFHNFWRMVEHYDVRTVFMLCNLIEKTKIKCDRYFPQEVQTPLVEKEYQITLLEETHQPPAKKALRTKKLQVVNTNTGATRVVTHYQVADWPDGEVPNSKRRKHIHFLLDQLLGCIAEKSVPVVHCSAGVGRTGTFIAMAQLRLKIRDNQPISIFNEVRKLREQRWGMVHTLAQYEHLYDFA